MNSISLVAVASLLTVLWGSGCEPDPASPCDTNHNGALDSEDEPFAQNQRAWIAIESQLPWVDPGEGLALTELDSVSSLNFSNSNGEATLTDLDFIGCFPQLVGLDLSYQTEIRDYSPLETLTKLETLSVLGSNARPDDVAGLTSLITLSAAYCHWETLEPLSNLTNLEKLLLRQNGSREHPLDLTGLEAIQDGLSRLDLRCNGLQIIGPLAESLGVVEGDFSLDLSGNPAIAEEDIEFLRELARENRELAMENGALAEDLGSFIVAHRRLNCAANPDGRLNLCDTNGNGKIELADGTITDQDLFAQLLRQTNSSESISLDAARSLRQANLFGIHDLAGFDRCFPAVYELRISNSPEIDLLALRDNEAMEAVVLEDSPGATGFEVFSTWPEIRTIGLYRNSFPDQYFASFLTGQAQELTLGIFGNPEIACSTINRLRDNNIVVWNDLCVTSYDSNNDGYLSLADGIFEGTSFYTALVNNINANVDSPENVVSSGSYSLIDFEVGIPTNLLTRIYRADLRTSRGIENLAGLEAIDSIVQVYVNNSPGIDLTALGQLRHLQTLQIERSPGLDLEPLATSPFLYTVDLSGDEISDGDLAPLVRNSNFADRDTLFLSGIPEDSYHPNIDALRARGVWVGVSTN